MIFKAVEGLQFLTRAELIFFFTVFARAVCHVYTLLLGRGYSTIVEGQRLGTVHIMEGTCSRLRFFVRIFIFTYTHTHTHTRTHTYANTCTKTCACACVFFFVVWCRVMSCAARRWVVGCGVVLSTCRCRGGLCPCVVVRLIASS